MPTGYKAGRGDKENHFPYRELNARHADSYLLSILII